MEWNMALAPIYTRHTNNFFEIKRDMGLACKEQIAITRLKIGHTNFSHSHLMKKEEPPICEICQENISVDHIITTCLKFSEQRRKYGIQQDIMVNLNTKKNYEVVLKYMKNIDLFNNI